MAQKFSTKLIGGLLIGGAVIAVLIVAGVYFYSQSAMGASMSKQGWIALAAGTTVSVLVSAALSATLILGRRNGFDETAGQIEWKLSDDD